MWSLQSTNTGIKRTAALVTVMTWMQNLHQLEVAQAMMEWQVQSWATNSEFVQNASTKDQLTDVEWPALFKKKLRLVFALTRFKLTYNESDLEPWPERRR